MKATIHHCKWIDEIQGIAHYSTELVELPPKSLDFLQREVGGYIDIWHNEKTGRDWVINDEGILLGLPLNKFALEQNLGLCGTIIEVHGVLS